MARSSIERFRHQLPLVSPHYSTETIEKTSRYAQGLQPYYSLWERHAKDLEYVRTLSCNRDVSYTLLKNTVQGAPFLLGVAGPGAVGKDTVIDALMSSKKVNSSLVTTTTRDKREGEIDGVDYHFVSPAEFERLQENDNFAVQQYRPGRGKYGIRYSELTRCLERDSIGVVQESPRTLLKLFKQASMISGEFGAIIVYLLPPEPIFHHLALRFFQRSKMETDCDVSSIMSQVDSTLGHRQVKEFKSALSIRRSGQVEVFFLANETVEQTVEQIVTLISFASRAAVLR